MSRSQLPARQRFIEWLLSLGASCPVCGRFALIELSPPRLDCSYCGMTIQCTRKD